MMDVFKNEDNDFRKYLAQKEKAEKDYLGTEDDDEAIVEDDFESKSPYDVQLIRIESKPITIFQIEHWFSSGSLDMYPEFQRHLVWDIARQSRLIESLLLRIPIPAFYFNEDNQGRKSVIDGKQRLNAIHSYIAGEYALFGLQYLKDFERKRFLELPEKLRTRIEDTTLNINILDDRCPAKVKFDVFRRVNTGGVPLNPQEIRNIMCNGSTRKFLQDMSGCEEFLLATDYHVKNVRMDAEEMCLRYLTVNRIYDWVSESLNGFSSLAEAMDEEVTILNQQDKPFFESELEIFRKVLGQCYRICSPRAFIKNGSTRINKQLFTAWVVVFRHLSRTDEELHELNPSLTSEYERLLSSDESFLSAITSSTGSRRNIQIAVHAIYGLFHTKI